jgi:hypothetical protein
MRSGRICKFDEVTIRVSPPPDTRRVTGGLVYWSTATGVTP